MEDETKAVISFHIISKDEIEKGSSALEAIAAKICLQNLKKNGLKVEMFVTDRSISARRMVEKFNKEEGGNIRHEFDTCKKFYAKA